MQESNQEIKSNSIKTCNIKYIYSHSNLSTSTLVSEVKTLTCPLSISGINSISEVNKNSGNIFILYYVLLFHMSMQLKFYNKNIFLDIFYMFIKNEKNFHIFCIFIKNKSNRHIYDFIKNKSNLCNFYTFTRNKSNRNIYTFIKNKLVTKISYINIYRNLYNNFIFVYNYKFFKNISKTKFICNYFNENIHTYNTTLTHSLLFLEVKLFDKFYNVYIHDSRTVLDLKLLIARLSSVKENTFYLSTTYKFLNESIQLHFFNLKTNSLVVHFRLKGGNKDELEDASNVFTVAPASQRSFFLDKDNSPNTWLMLLEFSFSGRKTNPCLKAQHLLTLLPTELLQSLGSKILDVMSSDDSNKYTTITNILRDFYKPSEMELFETYFRTQSLGNLTPSQFLSKICSDLDRLHPGSSLNKTTLKRFFLSVLPPTVRAILAGSDNSTIEEMASTADKIIINLPMTSPISNIDTSIFTLIKNLSDQVASLQLEVTSQRRSRSPNSSEKFSRSHSRSKSTSRLICKNHFRYKDTSTKCCIGCNWIDKQNCDILPICIYHSIFAERATNCLSGCTFQKN